MNTTMNRRHIGVGVLLAAGVLATVSSVAAAQAGQAQLPRGARRGAASAGAGQSSVLEVQQLFDAYAVMQAEQALQLDEMQYAPFVSRLRAMQRARRMYLQARNRIIQELAKLTAPQLAQVDEALVSDRLRALADLDAKAAADMRAAYDVIDGVLTVRQRARFRVLEQQLERRKFDLLARARRAAEAGAGRGPSSSR